MGQVACKSPTEMSMSYVVDKPSKFNGTLELYEPGGALLDTCNDFFYKMIFYENRGKSCDTRL
jgi:hypothetical protein